MHVRFRWHVCDASGECASGKYEDATKDKPNPFALREGQIVYMY